MRKETLYTFYAIRVIIICFAAMYVYSCLPADALNILQTYYTEEPYNWSLVSIATPVTTGGLAAIVFTFVFGTFILKYGIRNIFCIALGMMGICQIILAHVTNYCMFYVAMFLTKVLATAVCLGIFAYCANWFYSWKGRALGIITIGAPLNSATSVALMNWGIDRIGFCRTYEVIGVTVLFLAALAWLFCKDTPEIMGVYPKGKEKNKIENTEDLKEIESYWTVRKIFRQKETWCLILGFGTLIFMIGAIMPNFLLCMTEAGLEKKMILQLLFGSSVLGIFISYLFGVLDDKLGTRIACIILSASYILMSFCYFWGNSERMGLIILGTVGVAAVTGGTPNLHPSMTASVYGRKAYMHCNRYVQTVMYIIPAFSTLFMSSIYEVTGTYHVAFGVMLVLSVLAMILFIKCKRTFDIEKEGFIEPR